MENLAPRAAAERSFHNERMMRADFDKAPFTIAWEVTRACAYACVHCRADAMHTPDPHELTTEESLHLIDRLAEFGSPILIFTGGDPMMRKDLHELIAYAAQKGLRCSLTPTATALPTTARLEKVRDAGIRRIALSLDAPRPEIHDNFRQVKGSWQRTMDILHRAQSIGVSVQVNTTVAKHNVDILDEMVPFLKEVGAVQWSLFFLVPTGRGKLADLLSADEFEQVFERIYRLSKTANFDIKTTEAQHYRRYLMQQRVAERKASSAPYTIPEKAADTIGRAPRGLNDGKGFAFISHTGEVFPSGFLPESGGNLRRQPLATIYRESPVFRELRDTSKLEGKCGACEYKEICGGSRARAYALTGDPLAQEPCCIYQPRNWKPKTEDDQPALCQPEHATPLVSL